MLERLEKRVIELSEGKYIPVQEGDRRQIVDWRYSNGGVSPIYGMAHWESSYQRLPNGEVRQIQQILNPKLAQEKEKRTIDVLIRNQEVPEIYSAAWSGLNEHQQNMVLGWLRKGRVATLEEALNKVNKRIEKDSQQGKKNTGNRPISADLNPI